MFGTTPVWGSVAWLGRRLTQVRVAALLVSLLYVGLASLLVPQVAPFRKLLGIDTLDLVMAAQFTWGYGCMGGILIICWIRWTARRESSPEDE
jgi:hypothetical protein